MSTELPEGLHPDLAAPIYHKLPHLGSGDIYTLADLSAAHFREYKDRPLERKAPDRTMQIGSVAHILALEPQRFNDRVVVVYDDDWRTKDAKAVRDQAFADQLCPILEPDLETAYAMNAKLKEYVGDLFAGCMTEMSAIARDPIFDVMVKMRADAFKPGDLYDYKTTEDASLAAFERRMADNGHHVQALSYRAIIEILTSTRPRWTWVVQEQKRPYVVNIFEPTPATWAEAEMLRNKALNLYVRCIEEGVWPGYSRKKQMARLPGYASNRLADAAEAGEFAITHSREQRKGRPSVADIQLGIAAQAP